MKCGNCPKTDGLCYTSLPPKVKCTVTGKFHEYGDDCDAGIAFTNDIVEGKVYWEANPSVKPSLCTHCIICDAPIELTSNEVLALEYRRDYVTIKVCDECKKAIMYIRNHHLD